MFRIEADGIIDRIGSVRTWTGEGGRTKHYRDIVLFENSGKYPNFLQVTFAGRDVDKLDGWCEGDAAHVSASVYCVEQKRNDGGTWWKTYIRGFDILPPAAEQDGPIDTTPTDYVEPDGITVADF